MLSAPAATAASAHRRAQLWNSSLHWALQNFFRRAAAARRN